MGTEIERKFLTVGDGWRGRGEGVRYRQGYLSAAPGRSVRVRMEGERAKLNVKGPRKNHTNVEYEYDIPAEDAEHMLAELCEQPIIDKTRYRVPIGDLVWEIDEFHGENDELIVAEVELDSADREIELPEFIGSEVSHDPRYLNVNLCHRPYRVWKERAAAGGAHSTALSHKFEEALVYANRLHAWHKRKGSEIPYVSHLVGVASLVFEHGGDEEQVIAALLHDAVEDQGGRKTLDSIERRFGDRVARMVEACTDTDQEPKPPWRERKEAYLADIAKKDDGALLVVSADKLHNARAILADYRMDGESLWERFSGERDGQLWFYRAVTSELRERGDNELVRELDRTVTAIEELAEACDAAALE